MQRATPDLSFDEWHNSEYALALAYARKGRQSEEWREWCADQIERIFDALDELYAKGCEQ